MRRVRILVRVLPMWEPCLFAKNMMPDEVGVVCVAVGELVRRGVPIRVEVV